MKTKNNALAANRLKKMRHAGYALLMLAAVCRPLFAEDSELDCRDIRNRRQRLDCPTTDSNHR